MSTAPNTTPNHLIASSFSDWKTDERVIINFGGNWCTNYGRSLCMTSDGLTRSPVRSTALDDLSISYIKAVCRDAPTVLTIVNVYYRSLRRKELEQILAEEVATEVFMRNSRSTLDVFTPSNHPEVNQAIKSTVESLAYSIHVIQHHIASLNDEIATLI